MKLHSNTIPKSLSVNILNSVSILLVHKNFCVALVTDKSLENNYNVDPPLLCFH